MADSGCRLRALTGRALVSPTEPLRLTRSVRFQLTCECPCLRANPHAQPQSRQRWRADSITRTCCRPAPSGAGRRTDHDRRQQQQLQRETPAVDNWPPAARLVAVAAAGQLPTAAPSHSERFSIPKSEQFSVGIDTSRASALGAPAPPVEPGHRTLGSDLVSRGSGPTGAQTAEHAWQGASLSWQHAMRVDVSDCEDGDGGRPTSHSMGRRLILKPPEPALAAAPLLPLLDIAHGRNGFALFRQHPGMSALIAMAVSQTIATRIPAEEWIFGGRSLRSILGPGGARRCSGEPLNRYWTCSLSQFAALRGTVESDPRFLVNGPSGVASGHAVPT